MRKLLFFLCVAAVGCSSPIIGIFEARSMCSKHGGVSKYIDDIVKCVDGTHYLYR